MYNRIYVNAILRIAYRIWRSVNDVLKDFFEEMASKATVVSSWDNSTEQTNAENVLEYNLKGLTKMRTKKNGNDFLKYLMDDEEDVEDHETDFLRVVRVSPCWWCCCDHDNQVLRWW